LSKRSWREYSAKTSKRRMVFVGAATSVSSSDRVIVFVFLSGPGPVRRQPLRRGALWLVAGNRPIANHF
jgi:hypothetical protein